MPERAVFPLPESYSLVCPYCRVWKMQPYRLAGIDGYRCIDHPLVLKCGKIHIAHRSRIVLRDDDGERHHAFKCSLNHSLSSLRLG